MKRLVISVVALAISAIPASAFAKSESGGMPRVGGHPVMKMPHVPQAGTRWGGVSGGRWVGGSHAPGGWNAYRKPVRGYVLPRYWISPSFYIANYRSYGFAQPAYGYGWSRYYDDAVLTDQYGRVYDTVPNVNWDRYEDGYYEGGDEVMYDDRYYDDPYYRDGRGARGKDRDGGLGGALIGGGVGAIAGSAIAGRGDRTAGALIGGGIGAIAGAAVDAGDRYGRGEKRKRLSKRDRRGYPSMGYDYDGVQGTHWGHGGRYPGGPIVTNAGATQVIHTGGGYGYGYGQPTVTTVIVQPAPITKTVTTTEYVTQTVYAKPAVKRVAKRKVVRRAKPRCVCAPVCR